MSLIHTSNNPWRGWSLEGSTALALTAIQDKPSDNKTYTNRQQTMKTNSDHGLTSQASSTLVSASTDTIRESMRSSHSNEDRRHGGMKFFFFYIPRANTFLQVASHSSASFSETSTNVGGCGLGSLQLDCENLLFWGIDLIRVNVEPSEDILDCEGYYVIALLQGQVEAYLSRVTWFKTWR